MLNESEYILFYFLVDEARIKEVGVDRAAAEWVLRYLKEQY